MGIRWIELVDTVRQPELNSFSGASGQHGWFIMEGGFPSDRRLSEPSDLLEPGIHHREPRSLLPVLPLWFEHRVRGGRGWFSSVQLLARISTCSRQRPTSVRRGWPRFGG